MRMDMRMERIEKLSLTELRDMLICGCNEIIRAVPFLTEIDTLIGDGDHGYGMNKGFSAMKRLLTSQPFDAHAKMLRECGMTLLKSMGGASGVLFSTLFISGSEAVHSKDQMNKDEFSGFVCMGASAVQRRGKARLGQKTMIDALLPAAGAIRECQARGGSFEEMLRCGSIAAEAGAESTKDMRASVGRSKGFREESLGVMDPGAVSVSRLFDGFYRYILNDEDRRPNGSYASDAQPGPRHAPEGGTTKMESKPRHSGKQPEERIMETDNSAASVF